MENFCKSLKRGNIWKNFEKYFLPRKMKILEKSAGICGKLNNLVKIIKNRKI